MPSIQFESTIEGEVLIKKGDTVDFNTPFYKSFSKQEVSIPLAKKLGTSSDKIFQSLKKFVGERVQKGDLIAEASAFLSTKKYISEYDGLIKEVNHQSGSIILAINTDQEDSVPCFFQGEITEIEEKVITESIEKTVTLHVAVKHVKEYELKEISDDFGGKVVYCDDPIKANLTEEDVNHGIIVDEDIPSYEQVKYEALGAKGFVSLKTLPEKSTVSFCTLNDSGEYKKILDHKYENCLVDKAKNKIFFYQV